jgi:hypothetical protein
LLREERNIIIVVWHSRIKMDISKCDQILKASVKRLTRPKLNPLDFHLGEPEGDMEMAASNKVSLAGIEMGEELVYQANFG